MPAPRVIHMTKPRHDDQSTLALHLVSGHGRASPLLWLSVWKDELKDQRNDFEDACLRRLAELVPSLCRVSILADRGFGDQKLFAFLAELGFGYVIRFRAATFMSPTRMAPPGPPPTGLARAGARVTAQGQLVGAVVCVHAKDMKEPWCLATSERDATAAALINHYAKRWTIEPQFRDTTDLRFGRVLSSTRIGEPSRRDRLLLVSAFATARLTLLGAVGENLGMDRLLKSNTSKARTHSLFRQGCMLYELILNMPQNGLTPLIEKFAEPWPERGFFR